MIKINYHKVFGLAVVQSAKQEMELSYSVFTDKGAAMLGHEFERLFNDNMNRQPNKK